MGTEVQLHVCLASAHAVDSTRYTELQGNNGICFAKLATKRANLTGQTNSAYLCMPLPDSTHIRIHKKQALATHQQRQHPKNNTLG